MKKGRKIALIITTAAVVIGAAAVGVAYTRYGGEIDVTAHGIIADNPDAADKNLKKLNKMLLLSRKGTVLKFPEGKYYISANFSGGLQLIKKKGITLRGIGEATLVNTSYTPYATAKELSYSNSNMINIVKSKNIVIEGLGFDYREITSASGVITDNGNGTTEITVYDQYADMQTGGFAVCLNFFDQSGAPTKEVWLPEDTVLYKKQNAEKVFVLPGEYGEIGQKACVRFTCWSNTSATVNINDTKNLTMRDLRIFSTPSACIFGGGEQENYCFDGIKVLSPGNSKALVCANGDGIHIAGLRGKLDMKNCVFSGMGDDALNIHVSAPTVKAINENRLTLVYNFDGESNADNFAKKGDLIELFDNYGNKLGESKVFLANGNVYTFDKIPEGTGEGAILNNISRQPETLVENCTVENGRARGILLQCKNATVKNCTFKNLRLPGILAAPDISEWHEMGPCENLLVRNCKFDNCCTDTDRKQWGAVTVTVGHSRVSYDAPVIHGKITVKDCAFSPAGKQVAVYGAKEIVEDNNVTLIK